MLDPSLYPILPWLTFGAVAFVVLLIGLWLARNPAGRSDDARARRRQWRVFGALTPALAGAIPTLTGSTAKLDRDLRRAGYYRPRAREDYLAVRNALVLGVILVTAAWAVATADMGTRMTVKVVAAGAAATILLFAVPRLYLQWAGTRRIRRIQVGLPDALDIVTMCLTGGLPLQAALHRVNGQLHFAHPELAQELDILRRQSDASSMEQALEQFAYRVDAPEIKTLTSLVGHAERLGTNVGFVIREYADSIRRAHRQRAEERGNKMTVQMLFPIALCLAPAAYILLLAPPVLEMRDFMMRENRSGGILAPPEVTRAVPPARPVPPVTNL